MTSPSKWVLGLALCGLLAFLGVASRYRPLKLDFYFQEQALSGQRVNHPEDERYDIRYFLPALDKLVVNLNGAMPPDTVFLAPEESGLALLGAQEAHQAEFKSLKAKEGRLHLQIMASGKFFPVPEKGYTLRIGMQGLSHLVIEDGMFFQSFRVPILSESPIRKPNFSLAFPKYCFLHLEVDVPHTLALKENGGLGGFTHLANPENIVPADSWVRGKVNVLHAQDLTTAWDLRELDANQVFLSADRYAVIRLGSPEMIALLHLIDSYRGGKLPEGKVSYRGSPTIRERYPRGRPQLRLVGNP